MTLRLASQNIAPVLGGGRVVGLVWVVGLVQKLSSCHSCGGYEVGNGGWEVLGGRQKGRDYQ